MGSFWGPFGVVIGVAGAPRRAGRRQQGGAEKVGYFEHLFETLPRNADEIE